MAAAGGAAGASPRIELPDPGLVVLVGPAGSGKSVFAHRHFAPGDVVSSDDCRALVAGDAGDQSATPDAFGLLRHILQARAKRRRLTVVDATNLTRRERARLLGVARRHELPAVAIVLALPLATCRRRATERAARPVPADIVARQHAALQRTLPGLADEPFAEVTVLSSEAEVAGAEVVRRPATDGIVAMRPAAAPEAGPGRPPAVLLAGMGRDAPGAPLVSLAEWVAHHATVVVLTGCPADREPNVRRWLADHGVVHDLLLLRPVGDRRPDTVVERERYRRDVAPHHDVRLVVDDRPRMIEVWRQEGLYALTAVDPRTGPPR